VVKGLTYRRALLVCGVLVEGLGLRGWMGWPRDEGWYTVGDGFWGGEEEELLRA
jgi:hypothetical protein